MRRLIQYVYKEVSEGSDRYQKTIFLLLPIMTDQERAEALPLLLDGFGSSNLLGEEAITLFGENYDEGAHRAALQRCAHYRQKWEPIYRSLDIGLSHLGQPKMSLESIVSGVYTRGSGASPFN